MKKWIFFSFLTLSLVLTSCIDIIDDVLLNNDGSGTFKYTVNLSASKVKINSILALDSMDGHAIPKKNDIKELIGDFKSTLSQKEGIKNVTLDEDYNNYFFKLTCDFESINFLQEAIKNTVEDLSKNGKFIINEHVWMVAFQNTLTRSIPKSLLDQAKKLKAEDIELLKQGTYTSITRFEKEIERFDNDQAQLSKNKRALMLKVNAHALMRDADIIKNKIYLAN
jgi:hypothetical protein